MVSVSYDEAAQTLTDEIEEALAEAVDTGYTTLMSSSGRGIYHRRYGKRDIAGYENYDSYS